GRYGGTYAHKDIAFEFGTWISPTFKLYLITEYQRLKEVETNQYNLEWNFKRIISKANYHIHTDAVKNHILPTKNYIKNKEWLIYAEEADLLNVVLFNCTAKDWREANKEYAKKGMNIRDIASINELAVLSNLESLNAEFVKSGIDKEKRFEKLSEVATYQLTILNEKDFTKALKKLNDKIYIDKKNKLKE
ncbi:MAG: KilA-N domain-containing protein, partial [Bacteroidota bacterium]|nr:KilA-N domain-containing protein [Bacteroidota bacterium]